MKVYLLCEGKRIKKKKTTVKKATLSPVYNEALVFDVPAENVEDVSLIVKVIDYDRYGMYFRLHFFGLGSAVVKLDFSLTSIHCTYRPVYSHRSKTVRLPLWIRSNPSNVRKVYCLTL